MNESEIRKELDRRYQRIDDHLTDISKDVKGLAGSFHLHNTQIELIKKDIEKHDEAIGDLSDEIKKEHKTFIQEHWRSFPSYFFVIASVFGMIFAYSAWKHEQTTQDKIQNEQLIELKALIVGKKGG